MTAAVLRRPAHVTNAGLLTAAVPAGALLGVAALHGAGLRVLLVVAVPLLALGAFGRRLPRGPRAATLVFAAVLLLGAGLIARSPLSFTGGLLLLAAGGATAWGVNRSRSRRRAWALRSLSAAAAALVLLFLVYPLLLAVDYLAKPREAVDGAALGLPHRDVSFEASDGVRLSGWYAPGTNGAAVVLVHGGGGDRQGTIRHARMLAAAGYGVLLYDARGRGESSGRENAFGWEWHRDVRGAVDFLAAAGVDRVGLLGLSTGAEAVVTEAASDARVGAVVADGLQGRTPADAGNLSFGNRISMQPAFVVLSAAIRAVSGEHEPAPLLGLVHRLAATRPLLLISTEAFERELDRAYVRGTAADLWELPQTAHTQGLQARPAAYAARVLALFDGALRPRR
jgi:pimeloyl-ACP methyl ester carboxylesterase